LKLNEVVISWSRTRESWIVYDGRRLPRIGLILTGLRVISCEITHSKNESLPIVFILITQSIHAMRVHNPKY
jgi:hypothetical protein